MNTNDKIITSNENRDPLSGEPGAHPVGTGVGAVLGGLAAGAATGTIAGPIGTAVGAAVGAVLGGLAGKGVAEGVDPTAEDAYWRDNYKQRPYVESGAPYDDYGPAYAYGLDAAQRYPGKSFDDIDTDLSRDWGTRRGTSSLGWDKAKSASRDAWTRASNTVERAIPGDSDRDGR